MTVKERNETIEVILVMWRKITTKKEEEKVFYKKLQVATDFKLASIFSHYKGLIKEQQIKKEPGMYVSNSTYIKITECLNNKPKSSHKNYISENIQNPILIELMTIKQKDFFSEVSGLPEGEENFLDYQKLSSLNEERQEQVLALILYFSLLKCSNIYELTKSPASKNQIIETTQKIKTFFPYRSDFYRYTWNHFTEHWEQISETERLEQLRILLQDVVQKTNFVKKRTKARTDI